MTIAQPAQRQNQQQTRQPTQEQTQHAVTHYVLRNAHGMEVILCDRGAALVGWLVPDRHGQVADVLLGYGDPDDYIENPGFFGAAVGRWANRIRDGRFALDGTAFQLECNDRGNHLHGAAAGLHRVKWQASQGHGSEYQLTFTHTSPDGSGGYPGNLSVQLTYTLQDDGSLVLRFKANTDAPTPINLTSHPYFNLNGGASDIGRHLLTIHADHYMEIDAAGIPVRTAPVQGTPFDMRQPAAIGTQLAAEDQQLRLGHGFDHFFCARLPGNGPRGLLRELARVADPDSGRCLQVFSTEDGLQFYSGNALAGVAGKRGVHYAAQDGFCLEAHACPDQINTLHAGEVVLRPGQTYTQTTIYRLTVNVEEPQKPM